MADRQLDYVFASRGIASDLSVRALNELKQWGPSDHCRITNEILATDLTRLEFRLRRGGVGRTRRHWFPVRQKSWNGIHIMLQTLPVRDAVEASPLGNAPAGHRGTGVYGAVH